MARTNATDVKLLLNSDVADATADTFITTANLLVTDVLGSSSGLSSGLLEDIEKWLAAHLLAMSPYERQATKQKIDDAEDTYGKVGLRLDNTTYGQMVLVLDTSGSFTDLGKTKASINAVTSFE